MIVESDFHVIEDMWQDPEMWGETVVKPVSSLKFYDGVSYFGGNDIRVYDLSLSQPKFFLYLQNYKPAGCISYHMIDGTIRSRGIFVKQQYRKQGISEALLHHIIEECRQERPESFIWAMAGPNSMRVHFKCGFRQVTEQYIGFLPDGNISIHNNCYMRLDL